MSEREREGEVEWEKNFVFKLYYYQMIENRLSE